MLFFVYGAIKNDVKCYYPITMFLNKLFFCLIRMVVMKFGGSSVGDAERIKNVCEIVKSKLNEKPIVVLSAVKGITDKLIGTAKMASEGKDVSRELEEIKKKHYRILK